MLAFKWRQFAGDVILWTVRWYCRYGISYRDLEEMQGERRVTVDHTLGSALRARVGTALGLVSQPALIFRGGLMRPTSR